MSEINVTPMVDVMLVLLIIFMVTAPLLTVGVPIELPKSEAKQLEGDQGAARPSASIRKGRSSCRRPNFKSDEIVPKLTAIRESRI